MSTRFAQGATINTGHAYPWNIKWPSRWDVYPASTSLRKLLAPVPCDIIAPLEEEGLRAALTAGLESQLDAVDRLLSHVPDLAAVVHEVVFALHALAAEPGYDVSHSQPLWRNRIFVSFPERNDEVGALRLTESVIHEAMHLHLTNEETSAPLVAKPLNHEYSPWRLTDRPVGGVLHGIFVFVCIREFYRHVQAGSAPGSESARYMLDRMDCIDSELRAVDAEALETSLTPRGATLLRFWLGQPQKTLTAMPPEMFENI